MMKFIYSLLFFLLSPALACAAGSPPDSESEDELNDWVVVDDGWVKVGVDTSEKAPEPAPKPALQKHISDEGILFRDPSSGALCTQSAFYCGPGMRHVKTQHESHLLLSFKAFPAERNPTYRNACSAPLYVIELFAHNEAPKPQHKNALDPILCASNEVFLKNWDFSQIENCSCEEKSPKQGCLMHFLKNCMEPISLHFENCIFPPAPKTGARTLYYPWNVLSYCFTTYSNGDKGFIKSLYISGINPTTHKEIQDFYLDIPILYRRNLDAFYNKKTRVVSFRTDTPKKLYEARCRLRKWSAIARHIPMAAIKVLEEPEEELEELEEQEATRAREKQHERDAKGPLWELTQSEDLTLLTIHPRKQDPICKCDLAFVLPSNCQLPYFPINAFNPQVLFLKNPDLKYLRTHQDLIGYLTPYLNAFDPKGQPFEIYLSSESISTDIWPLPPELKEALFQKYTFLQAIEVHPGKTTLENDFLSHIEEKKRLANEPAPSVK